MRSPSITRIASYRAGQVWQPVSERTTGALAGLSVDLEDVQRAVDGRDEFVAVEMDGDR
ncbi:MAG: hypothetical protein ACI9YT_000793 [Halobacteriales archaeon]|jgi:hypothetical protein